MTDLSLSGFSETTGSTAKWWCAIHGTVTKCPFVYMSCDGTDLPAISQKLGEGLLLAPRLVGNEKGSYDE